MVLGLELRAIVCFVTRFRRVLTFMEPGARKGPLGVQETKEAGVCQERCSALSTQCGRG